MSKRKRCSVEFKKMIVQLYESGASVTDLTSKYRITSTTIYKWHDLYKKDGDTGASKVDLLEMQARITKLESENDILKKVLTIFAKSKHQGLTAIRAMTSAHSVKEICQNQYQHQTKSK